MVRLKCVVAIKTTYHLHISIPYGTIKSSPAAEYAWTYKAISIPYGSIKRTTCPTTCYQPSEPFVWHRSSPP